MVERIAVTGKEITLASVNSCACLVLKEADKNFLIASAKSSGSDEYDIRLEVFEDKTPLNGYCAIGVGDFQALAMFLLKGQYEEAVENLAAAISRCARLSLAVRIAVCLTRRGINSLSYCHWRGASSIRLLCEFWLT
jgi:hypothetical protein